MKKTVILLSALALFAVVSCNKAEVPAQRSEKHPVTLTVGLGAETRVSHEYADLGSGKKGIKTQWEAGDQVFVQYDGNTEVFDVVDIAGDGKSAEFHKEDSALPEGASFTVIYATPEYLTNTNDPSTFNINKQTGALDALPEYLVADDVTLGSPAELASQLTYFHFIFTKAAGSNVSLGSLQPISLARKTSTPMGTSYSGEFYVTPNATSKTKISLDPPSASIATWENGTIAKIDFHVAVFMPENNAGTTYHLNFDAPGLGFGHGGTSDGDAGLTSYTWTSTNQYTSGKVYKKEFAY